MRGLRSLINVLRGVDDDQEENPIIDLAPGIPDGETEIRYVNKHDNFGAATGGSRVRVAKSELKHPTVAKILLTESEHEDRLYNEAKTLLARLHPDGGGHAHRAVTAGVNGQIEVRRQQAERERVEREQDERRRDDLERVRIDRLAASVVETMKKSG